MRTVPVADRRLHELKERFLEGEEGEKVEEGVRPEIWASWQRSLDSGVLPDRIDPLHAADVDCSDSLHDLAEPVINHHFGRVSSANTAILLADQSARILTRWTADGALTQALDGVGSLPGSCLAEDLCGTNGLGTVFTERRPIQVSGAEHYADCYTGFTCVGVPVCHPMTGNIQGAITVALRCGSEDDLVLPFARLLREAIERRMTDRLSAAERTLLESFLVTRRRSGRPVITVSGHYLLADAAGLSFLGDIEHARLWARLVDGLPAHGDGSVVMLIDEHQGTQARVRPVRCGSRLVGATVEMHHEAARTVSLPSGRSPAREQRKDRIARLPGQERTWTRAADEVRRLTLSRTPLMLAGEPGTGKRTLLEAAAASSDQPEPCDVFDVALIPVLGLARWMQRVRNRLGLPEGWLILRHVDLLDERGVQALSAVLDEQPEAARPRVGATMAVTGDAAAPHLQPCLDRLAAVRVDVPPLRDRRADIRRIAESTLSRLHPDGTRQWSGEALQALVCAPWPDNVRQLESVVRSTAVEPGRLTVERLPEEVRNAAGTSLPRLDRLRREAIISALRETEGNKAAAAAELGISRSTLYRHLRMFGIDSQ